MRDVQEKLSDLKNLLAEILTTEPDGFGRIMRALSEVTNHPMIDSLALDAYREEVFEIDRTRIEQGEKEGKQVH